MELGSPMLNSHMTTCFINTGCPLFFARLPPGTPVMNFWETGLCALLATFIAILLGGLYTIGAFRKRKSTEPPLDKGLIPWIGHGISFGRNPVQFLERMMKKHGDIFTMLLGGNYLHIVMDPNIYGFIVKTSNSKLDFSAFAANIVSKVFNFQPTEIHHKIVKGGSKKYLRGKSLAFLNQIFMENLNAILLHNQDSGEEKRRWHQEGLLHFTYKTIFQAAFLTLFGSDSEKDAPRKENAQERKCKHCEKLFEEFQQFDQFFPQMILNSLDPQSKKETQRLRSYFWDLLSVEKLYERENISSWIVEQDYQMTEAGMNEKLRSQSQLLLLWASQANTGPAAFWLFAYLLKYPEAMKAVREEIERVLRDTDQGETPSNLSLQAIKTPLLDSAVEEVLRLKAGSFVFRSVMEDINLKMDDGREYSLRKGDHLLLFPFLALHMDPEIYPEPQTFKHDRFVSPEGEKKEFFKNGKKLKHHIMPFGGGPSMCPGRFFAVSEMKIFVILMLTHFDMELINIEEELPPSSEIRSGIGAAHPAHDIMFKYRLRL
ncbi:7-alpha-hydroxycholest-4-en-3-one 12-alpha-hydroxylase [Python bivittatus]|uniref:7-alpha-hydroxycholest-4-en-3-one 12-alpha-hydroxylase n=1 Tax=Python bivittatus TaxID=176946 RepID=A0A9F2QZ88_PYTBI|nr:7-alpha-hydroxycholest-4-en-3-one 12-alpha-hydroxylase [Python bivittatus]